MESLNRLWAVVKKEYIQFIRDRVTLAIILTIPALQLCLFGYAINTEVKHLPTVVFDLSRSSTSREIAQTYVNSQYFDIVGYVGSMDEVTSAVDSGRAKVAMVFPPDLERDIKRGRQAKIQLIFDASDPMTAASALNAGNAIGLYYSVELATTARRGGVPVKPPLEVRSRAWYNPSMITANFMVPGIIGALLMMVTMMLTAMAIVRERERGTLEQLLVSPVKRTELIIGKLVPYVGLAYIVISITLVLGRYLFGVPIAGSLALLYGLTFIFFMTTLGLGMFISTVAKTQQQAMQMSFFFFLPSMMLSGFMFPIAAMPGWVQPVSWFIPLTYYLEIVRGIILKGVGLEYLWRQALALVVFGVVILSLAVARMGKRLG